MRSTLALRYAEKENDIPSKRRVQHSASLLSLRSFIKRSSLDEQLPVISQPTLDDISREKVRHKVRQSPSMLSINALGGSELHTAAERRELQELLQLSSSPTLLSSLPAETSGKCYKQVSLDRSMASHVIQEVSILRILSSVPGIFPVDDVVVVLSKNALVCRLEFPDLAENLGSFKFESCLEAPVILMKLAEILAKAEEEAQFEHRNLHERNILVEKHPSDGRIANVYITNCALSRVSARSSSKPLYTSLDDQRFYAKRTPVLSQMRRVIKDPGDFVPATNVLWLRYIAKYLYSVAPSPQLKRMEDVLQPRWTLRKSPRSAREALIRLRHTS